MTDASAAPEYGWRGLMRPFAVVLAMIGLVIGLFFVLDQQASVNVTAWLYDLIGNPEEAEALRRGGGDRTIAKLLGMTVGIAVGVGLPWLFFGGLNWVVERLGSRWVHRLTPWVFVGPALLLLFFYLVWPAISTLALSIGIELTLLPLSVTVTDGFGFDDWIWGLTNAGNHALFRNNLIWLVVGTCGSVGLGLLIAGLVDRVKHESVAKTFIFLPLAISLVGASVIWRFIYVWRPEGLPQIGLLNGIWTGLGGEPIPFIQTSPINTYLLIVILIWLQTGFAMVILSAAIKGVPVELTEAARLDGASERQLFFRIIVPLIKGSLVTVTITTAIVVLKIFDIVFVMTGGRFDTNVVANEMILQMFTYRDFQRGAVLAVVLFIAVLPLMILNVRQMRQQGLRA